MGAVQECYCPGAETTPPDPPCPGFWPPVGAPAPPPGEDIPGEGWAGAGCPLPGPPLLPLPDAVGFTGLAVFPPGDGVGWGEGFTASVVPGILLLPPPPGPAWELLPASVSGDVGRWASVLSVGRRPGLDVLSAGEESPGRAGSLSPPSVRSPFSSVSASVGRCPGRSDTLLSWGSRTLPLFLRRTSSPSSSSTQPVAIPFSSVSCSI